MLDVPASVLRSLPDSCNLYMAYKTKGHKIKSASRPATPNTFIMSMRTSTSSLKEMDRLSQSSYKTACSGPDRLLYESNGRRSADKSDIAPMPCRNKFLANKMSSHEFARQMNGRQSLDNRSDLSNFEPHSFASDLSFKALDNPHVSDGSRYPPLLALGYPSLYSRILRKK